MVREREQPTNQTLVSFLDVKGLDTETLISLGETLSTYFEVKFGFKEIHWLDWGEKSRISSNFYLIGHLINKTCPDGNYGDKAPQISEEVQKRVEGSSPQELFAVCEAIAAKLKDGSLAEKDTYYQQMVKAYADMRREVIKLNKAGFILQTKVLPSIPDLQAATSSPLKTILSADELLELRRGGFYSRRPTAAQIQEFHDNVLDKDAKRSSFHKELSPFASQALGKNNLEVFLDIVTHERFKGGGLDLWKGDLCFTVGIKLLEQGPNLMEFVAYTPELEKYYEEQVKKACEFLQKVQAGKGNYGYVKYESSIDKKHEENDDIVLLKPLLEQFPGFLHWDDRCVKYMHGSYLFVKRLVINVEKIKAEKKDPEGFIDDLTAAIKDLVGEEEVFLSSID